MVKTKKMVWEDTTPFPVEVGDEEMSIADGKRYHEALFRDGEMVDCKCCGQIVKPYSRSIYKSQIHILSLLNKGPQTGTVLSKRTGGGDHAKLVKWKLVYRIHREDDPDLFAITDLGRRFLHGEALVVKYKAFFNGEVWGESVEQVRVTDCVKDFSLEEILDPANFR